MFELSSCIIGSELPVNALLKFVSRRSPRCKQRSECGQIRNPAVRNTLTTESRQLNFGNIQPAPMFWSVMYLKSLGKFSCMLWWKCCIKRSNAVSVQIVHDQNYFFSIGILLCKPPFYLLCPILTRSPLLRINISPA